jgi:hypothetical protein
MIIGATESYEQNSISLPELIAVLKAAATIPTCVQYRGVLQGAKGHVLCDLHFYGMSTLGCKTWTEGGSPIAYTSRRFTGWKQVIEFILDLFPTSEQPVAAIAIKSVESIVNEVYYPDGNTQLTPFQLAQEAGSQFRASDYPERITGKMCDCVNGGKFELLPKNHPDVIEGGKRYMICRVCGGYSHL